MENCDVKRVAALYRVSTKKQVDKRVDDIPVQKTACHEFTEQKGWPIVFEFCEKGCLGLRFSQMTGTQFRNSKN